MIIIVYIMKHIRIFIGSSSELDEDRRQFDNYFSDRNKIYIPRYICFDQRTWKDFRSSVSNVRLQDRYNAYIKTCDIAIFLFHTKIGQYTEEELGVALDTFHRNGHRPQVYVFLKEEEGVGDPRLADFKRINEEKLGHFCDTYTDYADLMSKFDRQLQILENEGFIRPDPIDVKQIVKYGVLYFLLPVFLLLAVFFALRYYSTVDMNISVEEDASLAVPGLSLQEGMLRVSYGDGMEQEFPVDSRFRDFVVRDIHSKFRKKGVRIVFEASGYCRVDTLVPVSRQVNLTVRRDGTLGTLFGTIIGEDGAPLEGVAVTLQDMTVITDSNGNFLIEIPPRKQKLEQRVYAVRNGYERWDFTAPVSADVPWNIVLKRK